MRQGAENKSVWYDTSSWTRRNLGKSSPEHQPPRSPRENEDHRRICAQLPLRFHYGLSKGNPEC